MRLALALACLGPSLAVADPFDIGALPPVDVVLLGEVHDNPLHHQVQAEVLAALGPPAVVFEMLSPGDAALIATPDIREAQEFRTLLDWDNSGWPEYDIYAPVFASLGAATVYGAEVGRDEARQAFERGAADVFGPQAALYGLDQPLPETEQSEREAEQMAAHCDALPPEILPGFVAAQRLRDARLAQAIMQAMEDTGGPVAVITGNGHARTDWGVSAVLRTAAPELTVFSIGQVEGEADFGPFDLILTGPVLERDDPCAAFAN